MRSLFNKALALLFCIAPLPVLSQLTALVSTSVQLPAPRFLEDFADKTQVIINATTSEDASLRFTIKGDNGIEITTSPAYNPFNVVLTIGAPIILTGIDIQSYFLQQNLLFSGITPSKLSERGLPPGSYRVCVRVVNSDYIIVSGDDPMGCSNQFFVLEADPPILVNPSCGDSVNASIAPALTFSWTPAAGAPLYTQYRLQIVEFPQEGMNPAAVISSATTPSFFDQDVSGYSYFYGPTDPQFEVGKSYAWTVVARDDETGTWFKNNGQSDVCWFKTVNVNEELTLVLTPQLPNSPGPIVQLMPMSTVTGNLKYQFNTSVTTSVVTASGPGTNSTGGGVFMGNPASTPWLGGSSTTTFNYNTGLGSTNAKPLSNVKISLVRKYIIKNGYFSAGKVENFVIPDVGHLYMEVFNYQFPNSGQVLATTTTDANGNFSFFFINADSVGQVKENLNYIQGPPEFRDKITGTVYSAFRIIVESPYYCSPENDIIVQPWETKNAGDVVALAKDYNLRITVKSVESSIQQIGGGGNELNDAEVSVVRKNAHSDIPDDEGQNLNIPNPKGSGIVISKGKTNQEGQVLFTRMMRHQKEDNSDRYTIQSATNKLKGNYNYNDKSIRYDALFPAQMSVFPYTGDLSITTWNSQYQLETKNFDVSMWPAKPRVFGRITNTQGQPLAGVNCVIMSSYTHPENYSPEKFFKVVKTGPEGYFEFNDLDVELSGQFPDLITDGPKRTLLVKVNGYKFFEKNIGILSLGQQTDLKTIALESDGYISGRVEDETGTAVQATVIFNSQISTETHPIFVFNPFSYRQVFSAAIPSGSVIVKVIPANPSYEPAEYTFNINKSIGGAVQNIGVLKVFQSKHRISFVVKERVTNKPVKDVMVKVKMSDVAPVVSNASGQVSLSFSSMVNNFALEIIPPDDKDLLPLSFSVYNSNTTSPVDYGIVLLEPAVRISGTVTYGNDKKLLNNAEVFLEQGSGGTNVSVKTDANGKYSLGKIPLTPSEVKITAGKTEPGITIIAQTKTIDTKNAKTVDFNLPVFDKMSITEVFGFPVMVEALTDEGPTATISGRFKNIPSNDNFSIEATNFMMEFENIKMIKLKETTAEGVPLTRPELKEVKTDIQSIPIKIHQEYYANNTPAGDYFFVKSDVSGSGYLEGKVKIENSSFQFSNAVLSFNNEPMYLGETVGETTVVKTLTAKTVQKRIFRVMDEKGDDLNFKILGFDGVATKAKSILDGPAIKLNATISSTGIPLMNPQKFELNVGDIVVKKTGFDPVNGEKGFEFKLEKWVVVADKWSISKENNCVTIQGGKVKTGFTELPYNALNISPSNLYFNGFKFGNMTLSGVVPLEILTSNITMQFDASVGSDMKQHWRLAAIGQGGQPAARIGGLPGMVAGSTINFQIFETISNNESQVSFGNQNQQIAFHKVYKMTPVSLNSYENYFQLSGLVDLGIPRVNNNFTGILEFSKKTGVVEMEVKTLPINFEGPGKVHFYNTPSANSQKLDPAGFEATGKVKDEEGIELLVKLYRKPSDIFIEVTPLGQILPVGDGEISLTDVKGFMKVKNSDWDYFNFDGAVTGAKGVEGKQRLGFTIYGDIEANSEEVSLKNINTPFGGMNITYDFKNGRMTGDLNINQSIGGIGVNGTANLLVDGDGYYILAGGSASPPGIGLIQAGMMFGNYPSIAGETKNKLMQYAYDKNLPPSFSQGIKGFFITGTKNFPIDIPDIDVDLTVVSVAFGADVGADARIWMNFAESGTNFGIGAMIFAHAYFVCSSMICTEFGADARAELGMKGDYNTASGAFSLLGCGSLSVSAHGEQCIGAFGGCISPCVDLGFTKSIKVDLLLDSNGSASIDLGLGNCSGQPPLTGGW